MQIAGTSLRPLEIWRSDVSLDEARNFATSTLATIVRLGSGGMVHGVGPRPHDALVLYDLEWDPASRIVREALSELDEEVQNWLREAYQVGTQEHLSRR